MLSQIMHHQYVLPFLAVALGLLGLLYLKKWPPTLGALLLTAVLVIISVEVPYVKDIGIRQAGPMMFAAFLGILPAIAISQLHHCWPRIKSFFHTLLVREPSEHEKIAAE